MFYTDRTNWAIPAPPLQSGLNLSVDGILGSLVDDLPVDSLDLTDIPPAEDLWYEVANSCFVLSLWGL